MEILFGGEKADPIARPNRGSVQTMGPVKVSGEKRINWFPLGFFYGNYLELGYGLTENRQISQDMYRLVRKDQIKGYQLNDRGLVE